MIKRIEDWIDNQATHVWGHRWTVGRMVVAVARMVALYYRVGLETRQEGRSITEKDNLAIHRAYDTLTREYRRCFSTIPVLLPATLENIRAKHEARAKKVKRSDLCKLFPAVSFD